MNSGAHVLVVGRDQMLMQSRGLILGTYFQFTAANRLSEAISELSQHVFDLVVLCHSLSDDEYSQVECKLNSLSPHPKVLALNLETRSAPRIGAEHVLSSADGSYALLKKAAQILDIDLKAKGMVTPATRRHLREN